LKFRRQHPYAQYILDNYCIEKRLVVEADGGLHLDADQALRDQARTEFLATEGILVLRFTNEKILNDVQAVLKKIIEVANTR
jgi:very-short-patch-repair endonuclease